MMSNDMSAKRQQVVGGEIQNEERQNASTPTRHSYYQGRRIHSHTSNTSHVGSGLPPRSCDAEELVHVYPESKPHHYRSTLVSLLCGVYVVVLLVLGCAIPLSSEISRGKPGVDYYVEVFYLYIYLTSILFIVLIHICLKCDVRADPPALWEPRAQFSTSTSDNLKLSSSDSSSLEGKPEDRLSSDDAEGYNLATHYEDHVFRNQNSTETNTESKEEKSGFISDKAEGVNFYLRLGAMGFATGSMIHDGFKVAQIFEIDDSAQSCYGVLYMISATAHLLFTFTQTYFIFKNHRLVINKYKPIMRMGLSHLVATNINVWSGTLIYEIAEDIKEKFEIFELVNADHAPALDGSNHTTEADWLGNCENQTHSLARYAARFLFPCTIEYSLISAAVVYKIYCSVGDVSEYAQNIPTDMKQDSCHKAHQGLFFGLFICILTLISISLFYVYQDKDTNIAAYIFYASEIVLLLLGIVAAFMGFIRMRHLHFTGERIFVDTALLLISVFGVLVFNSFAIVSTTSRIKLHPKVCSMALATSVLAFFESIFQTIFILDSLGRCPKTHKHVLLKPGRAAVTFLLMCNLCLWLINTFEMERTDAFPIHTEHYGALSWSIITHCCLPMLIFFRFHSSICLSDIWVGAYHFHKKQK